jgi:5-hydroxyisourate hydrolase
MASSPITCHVLDTTTGRPAASLGVTLTLLAGPASSANSFEATTDSDGRVKSWSAIAPGPSLQELFAPALSDEAMVWSLRFNTGSYFGQGKTFFPEVEVKFFVSGAGEHYHVPLLLGPFSYTTYRGS